MFEEYGMALFCGNKKSTIPILETRNKKLKKWVGDLVKLSSFFSREEMHLFDQVVANDIEIDSTEHNKTRTISLLNELSTQAQTNIIETGCSEEMTSNISGPSDTVTPMQTLTDDKFNKAKTSEGNIHNIEVSGNSHKFIKRAAPSSSSGSSYNGADKGLYAWSQTITDIEVEVRSSGTNSSFRKEKQCKEKSIQEVKVEYLHF